jgi:septum formation protein
VVPKWMQDCYYGRKNLALIVKAVIMVLNYDKSQGMNMLHTMLKDKKLILASASPRRKEIFLMLGLSPLIIPSNIHEPIENVQPGVLVRKHSFHKAKSVAAQFDDDTVVVGADTLVYLDKTILGKPRDRIEASEYLLKLSGRSHTVFSGIAISYKRQILVDYEKSVVTFSKFSDTDLEEYIDTKEPFDKAGAYGIQGYGSQFITSIKGCYFNVMGFPVHLFYKMLSVLLIK